VVLAGAYERRCWRHFADSEPPLDTDLNLPLLSMRMDEIRAALLRSELQRLPVRLAAFRRNYAYVSAALADLPGIEIRQPVAPVAYLGEALIFRVPDGHASWFADALCAEGIDARNLGSAADANVRAFWNWRFLFGTAEVAEIQAELPATTRYLCEAVDVPLSSSLEQSDCDDLISAVRRVANSIRARSGAEELSTRP
jgi:dTDP-4-amino-4,6-dideoxygalactose transaminase